MMENQMGNRRNSPIDVASRKGRSAPMQKTVRSVAEVTDDDVVVPSAEDWRRALRAHAQKQRLQQQKPMPADDGMSASLEFNFSAPPPPSTLSA
jgi:hypothetical protein